jgi:putative Mn2+ efflux pump MntP
MKFKYKLSSTLIVGLLIILGGYLLFVDDATTTFAEDDTPDKVNLPIFGEIDVMDYSLVTLAILLGTVDGFNPCAMWALVFLISIAMGLKDRRKLVLLVGSFVFASGVLYFLFMTAWLNAFLFVGYVRPIIIGIGLLALGIGIFDLKDFFMKTPMVCKVGSSGSKKKLAERMQNLMNSPITWATFFGIIALAFVINAIEFLCSAAIPAVFTQTLALKNLPTLSYYGYILLYDFFFMLDDLIIFGLAAFAVNQIGDKYGRWCKLIGGIVLVLLGIMMLFAPNMLQ